MDALGGLVNSSGTPPGRPGSVGVDDEGPEAAAGSRSERSAGERDRPAKHGLHGELRRESAGPDGSLQCADMDAEVPWAQPAVPHPKRVQGDVEQPGKVALGEIRVATQLAKLVHAERTMPSAAPHSRRSETPIGYDMAVIFSAPRTWSDVRILAEYRSFMAGLE